MKTCTKCGETKPKNAFSLDSSKIDGLRSNCKKCSKPARSAWYKANRDRSLAINDKWRAENPDRLKEIRSNYRETALRKAREYNEANKEKRREYFSNWQKSNLEKFRIYNQNRRAIKRANGGTLSKDIAEKLLKLQRGKCACCGLPLGDDYHLDHILPLALGGTNTDDNMQLLTSRCNMQKRAKHPVDFMQERGFLL